MNHNAYLGLAPVPFALAGGSSIFAGFLVVFFFAIVYGLYTVKGSGIAQRPYRNQYGGAPGAYGSSTFSRSDMDERMDWSRGTR